MEVDSSYLEGDTSSSVGEASPEVAPAAPSSAFKLNLPPPIETSSFSQSFNDASGAFSLDDSKGRTRDENGFQV